MKKILVLLAVCLSITLWDEVKAEMPVEDFSHTGSFSVGGYTKHNEFDVPQNTGTGEVAKWHLNLNERLSYKRVFIYGEGDAYFGRAVPKGESSYDPSPMALVAKGGIGFDILKNTALIIESGRTFDLGQSYSGDRYLYTEIKAEVRW